jgi:hypothetical protein
MIQHAFRTLLFEPILQFGTAVNVIFITANRLHGNSIFGKTCILALRIAPRGDYDERVID